MDALESLRRQHHALLPAYLLRLPAPSVLATEQSQRWLIDHVMHDATLADRHPERGYQKQFWRRVVAELEKGVRDIQEEDPDSDIEVDETFYEHLASLMVSSADLSDLPKQSYRTFVYDTPAWTGRHGQEGRVTLLEEQVAIQAGTTGLRTWTASLHLAHHILHRPDLLRPPHKDFLDRTPPCIELGAGTGFLSILLAQLGSDVVATDLGGTSGERQTPLDRLRENVTSNADASMCRVEELDWTDALLDEDDRPAIWREVSNAMTPRTIVAADVIYDPDLVPLLVQAIRVLLDPKSRAASPVAIVSATVRNPSTLDLFVQTCATAGLSVVDLDLTPMDPANPTFWDSALDAGSDVRLMRISKSHS